MCVRTYLILEAEPVGGPRATLASAYRIDSTDMNACMGLALHETYRCCAMKYRVALS